MHHLPNRITYLLTICLGLLCFKAALCAAPPPQGRAKNEKKILLKHVDHFYFDQQLDPEAQFLVGNVALLHDGVRFFCDSAQIYEQSNSFRAFGRVKMLQGDTLTLTSDSLFYNGASQIAEARSHVTLRHRKSLLETDSLNYDRLYNIGYFFNGGRLTDAGNVLTADWGEYHLDTKQATFNYKVRLTNENSTVTTDTLHYDTYTKIADVFGPSNIDNKENHIYTLRATYDTQSEKSVLRQRSTVKNSNNQIIADSIINDKKTGISYAYGHAIIDNYKDKNSLSGGYIYYNDSLGEAVVTDSASLREYASAADTLYLHADTFKLFTYHIDTDSVFRKIHAYPHARAYRTDVQMVADSLSFTTQGNILSLYKDPIMWQHNQQILGEFIHIFLNDSTIDSVQVINQALLVDRLDSLHYNQIASSRFTAYFAQGVMSRSVADGNVQVVFYQIDKDSLIIGMNVTETTRMIMTMNNRKLSKIWTPAATGSFYPPLLFDPTKMYLANFAWFGNLRPQDKEDIFHWVPKQAGTELKVTPRHQAPLQTL